MVESRVIEEEHNKDTIKLVEYNVYENIWTKTKNVEVKDKGFKSKELNNENELIIINE